jgi:lysophospholipase L1-like esterase
LGAWGECHRINDYLQLQPDLIIEYNGVNDICTPLLRRWVMQAAWWQKCLRQSLVLRLIASRWFLPDELEMRSELRATILDNLSSFADKAREQHATPTAFASFACPKRELPWAERCYLQYNLDSVWVGGYIQYDDYRLVVSLYNDELEKMCRSKGLAYLPVAEHLEGGIETFVDICHMTDSGKQRMAQAVYDALQTFVSGPWSIPPQDARHLR